jgi:hypothetical protein
MTARSLPPPAALAVAALLALGACRDADVAGPTPPRPNPVTEPFDGSPFLFDSTSALRDPCTAQAVLLRRLPIARLELCGVAEGDEPLPVRE